MFRPACCPNCVPSVCRPAAAHAIFEAAKSRVYRLKQQGSGTAAPAQPRKRKQAGGGAGEAEAAAAGGKPAAPAIEAVLESMPKWDLLREVGRLWGRGLGGWDWAGWIPGVLGLGRGMAWPAFHAFVARRPVPCAPLVQPEQRDDVMCIHLSGTLPCHSYMPCHANGHVRSCDQSCVMSCPCRAMPKPVGPAPCCAMPGSGMLSRHDCPPNLA